MMTKNLHRHNLSLLMVVFLLGVRLQARSVSI